MDFIEVTTNVINNPLERPYHLLISLSQDGEGKRCHNNPSGCTFNPGLNKTVYMIGDSRRFFDI